MEVANRLDGRRILGAFTVKSCVLPVVRNKSMDTLNAHLQKYKPVAVIALGQSSRPMISIERVAINVDDYPIPDNDGNQVCDQEIIENGPTAYWSTLPIKKIHSSLQRHQLNAQISNSAGTFVCNHLFYQMQHRLQSTDVLSGFIHLPTFTAPKKSMSIEQLTRSIDIASQVVAAQLATGERSSSRDVWPHRENP